MTTPNRSRSFELSVLKMIERSLKSGGLAIDPQCARVYHHRSYYSKERDGDIVVDISLEIFRRRATSPFLVWVWECKNYGHSVPIDDIEEFHAKLQQIGADRTKGTIVTTQGFQRATVAYARSHGIGLVRVLSPNLLTFDLENVTPFRTEELLTVFSDNRAPQVDSDAIAVAVNGHVLLGFHRFMSYELGSHQ